MMHKSDAIIKRRFGRIILPIGYSMAGLAMCYTSDLGTGSGAGQSSRAFKPVR